MSRRYISVTNFRQSQKSQGQLYKILSNPDVESQGKHVRKVRNRN